MQRAMFALKDLYNEALGRRMSEFVDSASNMCYDRCVEIPSKTLSPEEKQCLDLCSSKVSQARDVISKRYEEIAKENEKVTLQNEKVIKQNMDKLRAAQAAQAGHR